MNIMEGLARLGDTIETSLRHPVEHVVRMTLNTPESCAYANELLMNPKSGWRLSRQDTKRD